MLGHFIEGSAFDDKTWSGLVRFDCVLARRFVTLFAQQDKVINSLLDRCTENGQVVFDFMPTSPASHLVGGVDTLVYGIRHVRSYPNGLHEVDLSSTVQVDDLEILITEAEEQRAREELQSVADKAGVKIVSARSPNYELPPENKIIYSGRSFWEDAVDEDGPLDSKAVAVRADKHRRRYVNGVYKKWDKNGRPDPAPGLVMYYLVVSVRKKSEQSDDER